MSGWQELGHDLGILASALEASPDANPRAFEQAAERLRAERPDESARDALARQLQLPLSLVEPWLENTLDLLTGDQAEPARRREAIGRLNLIAWALGEIPQDWPPEQEQAARHGWHSWQGT